MKPKQSGYRMPAEWEPHEATWLSWPHDQETWPKELPDLESTYIEIIEHLHGGEKVHVLVQDGRAGTDISQKLAERGISENIFIHRIKTNSPWIRDYGPVFVMEKGKRVATDWTFNAWGGKYKPFDQDNDVPKQIGVLTKTESVQINMVFEGGSIDVNGLGTAMVTEECLLNPNRNPGLGRKEIEKNLRDFLGAKNVIWLKHGIAGDDTDGHVDEVARFTDSETVVAAVEEDPHDVNYQTLKENFKILSNTLDQNGKKFKAVSLPTPQKVERGGKRFPASYLNFYIANECVLVPVFGDQNDTKALGVLKNLFPDRMVAGIPAFPLIYGQGAIHCITQQEPLVS